MCTYMVKTKLRIGKFVMFDKIVKDITHAFIYWRKKDTMHDKKWHIVFADSLSAKFYNVVPLIYSNDL